MASLTFTFISFSLSQIIIFQNKSCRPCSPSTVLSPAFTIISTFTFTITSTFTFTITSTFKTKFAGLALQLQYRAGAEPRFHYHFHFHFHFHFHKLYFFKTKLAGLALQLQFQAGVEPRVHYHFHFHDNFHFHFIFTNYYFSKQNLQALLSNYNPGLALSPAAKQIELDLLRTLPSNKHYDSPHASGYHHHPPPPPPPSPPPPHTPQTSTMTALMPQVIILSFHI